MTGERMTCAEIDNYSFDFGTYTADINQIEITISANDVSKVYGEGDPELTYNVTGTLVDGDMLSGALVRVEGETV